MDFYLTKGSTYNDLILDVVDNHNNDYDQFYTDLLNSHVTFKMWDKDTGRIKIPYKVANVIQFNNNTLGLSYTFKDNDVDQKGIFEGQFIINITDTEQQLIVPIKDVLTIHIV